MNKRNTFSMSPEVIALVKRLYFQTSRLAEQGIAGGYKSAFRGKGIEFEEVRDYFPGDDIRSIDWKVTARMNKPYIKIYREERELNVIVAVDISSSTLTGTKTQLREALLAKVGAVLTLTALRNNDNVGMITFSDKVESYHPPRKARGAVWRILHEVLGRQAINIQAHNPARKTSIHNACTFLRDVLKRRSIIFILSDFFDENFEQSLAILAKRHDVTAVIARDPVDFQLPSTGLVKIIDPETFSEAILDTSNTHVCNAYRDAMRTQQKKLSSILTKYKIGQIVLKSDESFIPALQEYFLNKSRKHFGSNV